MNKISSLLKYLYAFGQISEYRYLREVYAQELPEEFLKNNFPYVYSIYESDENKPAAAYINMLNQIKSKFEIETDHDADELLRHNNALSFSDIVNLLKSKKEEIKSSEEDFYKETGIPEDKISELKFLGASKEEVLFILDEETRGNHSIEDAAIDLVNILKERNYIGSKGVEMNQRITDFDYLDEASDYFIGLANKLRFADNELSNDSVKYRLLRYYRYIYDGEMDPDYDYSDYKGIELGGAKANSKIVGKVGDYTIIYSSSMEAAQYWERGAVEIVDGNAKFHLCTSKIYQEGFKRENLYEQYKKYFMFQFIKNFSGEPKFHNELSNANDLITVCFKIIKGEAKVLWGGSDTVNSNNIKISEKHFNKSFKSSEEASIALDACKSFVLSSITEKAKEISGEDFFKVELQNVPECKDLIVEKAKEISGNSFFKFKLQNIPECKDFIVEKAKEVSTENFFNYGLQDIPECKDIVAEKYEELERIQNMNSKNFFEKYKLQNSPALNHITAKKAETLSTEDFLHYKLQYIPECKHLVAQKAEKLSALGFFGYQLEELPECKHLIEQKAKEVHPDPFFDLHLHTLPECKSLVAEKIKEVDPHFFFKDFFKNGGLQDFPELEHFVDQKAEKLSAKDFFAYGLENFPELKRFTVEKAEKLSPEIFFHYNLYKLPECKHLIAQKAEKLSPYNFFGFGLKDVTECKHLVEEKRKSLNNN